MTARAGSLMLGAMTAEVERIVRRVIDATWATYRSDALTDEGGDVLDAAEATMKAAHAELSAMVSSWPPRLRKAIERWCEAMRLRYDDDARPRVVDYEAIDEAAEGLAAALECEDADALAATGRAKRAAARAAEERGLARIREGCLRLLDAIEAEPTATLRRMVADPSTSARLELLFERLCRSGFLVADGDHRLEPMRRARLMLGDAIAYEGRSEETNEQLVDALRDVLREPTVH
jgi:hypothetical protein